MSNIPIKPGSNIPLSTQHPDGDEYKFVKAVVTKLDGTTLTGSPFVLPHRSDGFYSLESSFLTYPEDNTSLVRATYIYFNDAALTQKALDVCYDMDTFSPLDCESSGSGPIISVNPIRSHDLFASLEVFHLSGRLSTPEITGSLRKSSVDLSGSVSQPGQVKGEVVATVINLTATLEKC